MHPEIKNAEELVRIMAQAPVYPNGLTYNLTDQCVNIKGQHMHSQTIMFVNFNHKGHLVGYLPIKDEIFGVTYDRGYIEWVKYNGKRVYDGEEYDWNPTER